MELCLLSRACRVTGCNCKDRQQDGGPGGSLAIEWLVHLPKPRFHRGFKEVAVCWRTKTKISVEQRRCFVFGKEDE